VQDSQQPVAMGEVRFMNLYLDAYDVFFVFNKINFIPAREVAEVKENILDRLRPHRDDQRRDRHYFVNALAALEARMAGDTAAWQASAVAGFVDELSTFLATERHRAKLIGPAREVSTEIRRLRAMIPGQRALIEQTEAGLGQRYEEARTPLRQLEARARQMRRELDLAQQEVQALVRAEVTSQMVRLSSQMPDIIAQVVPEQEVLVRPWKMKGSAEAFAKELSEGASVEMASRFKAWQQNELAAILEPRLTAMSRQADDLFREFMRDLAKVQGGLTGLDVSDGDPFSGLDGRGALPDSDIAEMNLGSGGFVAKHIMKQIAANYGVLLVWAISPLGWIPLIIGVVIANTVLHGHSKAVLERKVRAQISAALAERVRQDAGQNADRSGEIIRKALSAAVSDLMLRVDGELEQLRRQVEDALTALHKGEDAVKEQRDRLAGWDRLLDESGNALEDLIADVALG
jgi:hypothetical protein